jgi:hypothetical protein
LIGVALPNLLLLLLIVSNFKGNYSELRSHRIGTDPEYEENEAEHMDKRSSLGYHIKLLLQFIQNMVIVSYFCGFLDHFFDYSTIGYRTLITPSDDIANLVLCYVSVEPGSMPKLYYKLVIIAILPVIKFLMLALILMSFGAVGAMQNVGKKLCSTLACIFLVEYFGIALVAIQYLSCVKVTSSGFEATGAGDYIPTERTEFYSQADLNYQCYTAEYMKYTQLVTLPVVVLWLGVVPLVFWAMLKTSREKLYQEGVKTQLGVFYNEYREAKYYKTDFFYMILRIVALVCTFVVRDFGVLVKITLVAMTFGIQLLFNMRKNPYKYADLNKINLLGLIVNILSLGAAYVVNDFGIADRAGLGAAIVIIVLTAYYWFAFLKSMCSMEIEGDEDNVEDHQKMVEVPNPVADEEDEENKNNESGVNDNTEGNFK